MFSLIIPVYNEENSVEKVVSEYYQALRLLPYPFEIIVVDDCSSDSSNEIAKKLPVKLITHQKNLGYGKSLKTGIASAQYDNIIITDSDNSYPGSLIDSLIEKYLEGANMTVASRSGENFKRSFTEKTARFCLRTLVELLVNRNILDVNSGYRIFNRKTVSNFLDKMSDGFSFTTSLTMVCAYNSIPIVYVPFNYGKREGKSKVSYLRDTLKTFQRVLILFYYFRIKRISI